MLENLQHGLTNQKGVIQNEYSNSSQSALLLAAVRKPFVLPEKAAHDQT